jgi:hypothetical protein
MAAASKNSIVQAGGTAGKSKREAAPYRRAAHRGWRDMRERGAATMEG